METLEFPKVLERLARRATWAGGRELALALRPTTSLQQALRLQRETTEARRLLEAGGATAAVPLGGIRDVREPVALARVGITLSPDQLLDIRGTLLAAARLRRYLVDIAIPCLSGGDGREEAAAAETVFHPLAAQLFPCAEVVDGIGRAVGESGEVLDSASPRLAHIRSQSRTVQARIRERLESLIHGSSRRQALQEAVITLRAGRFVVPVKQEHREAVPGILHDQSASGATLFIEPQEVVELNNRLKSLQIEEQEEIQRILAELSGRVARYGEAIEATLASLAAIDLIFAKARLSQDQRASEPQLNQEGRFRLCQGRHPLLTGDVVPVDVEVGLRFNTLVITGPNTGGKTVTLKLLGLLTLMGLAGLHVPAQPGSELSAGRVMADIGDRQSIEQSLSTFSSHIARIIAMLREVQPGSLVLLDELGAGTDPAEGAALAMAILSHLHSRGCRTVATTHYSELKSFAYLTEGMENASVEFDEESLKPTYRLRIGLPGSSQAFHIAARLGMPEEVLEDARSRMERDELRAEELIRRLQHSARSAEQQEADTARSLREAQQLKRRYEALYEELRARREQELAQAHRQAEALVKEAKAEADRLLGEARRLVRLAAATGPGSAAVGSGEGAWPEGLDLERRVRALRDQLAGRLERLQGGRRAGGEGEPAGLEAGAGGAGPAGAARAPEGAPFSAAHDPSAGARAGRRPDAELQAGDRVRLRQWALAAEVIEPPGEDGTLVVQAGSMKLRVPREQVVAVVREEAAGSGQAEGATAAARTGTAARAKGDGGAGTGDPVALASAKAASLSPEVDLRGMTVEEALAAADKHLDDALLAGLPWVRIIHGKGTGALRQAIRSYLTARPGVKSVRPGADGEGGDGVTVVQL